MKKLVIIALMIMGLLVYYNTVISTSNDHLSEANSIGLSAILAKAQGNIRKGDSLWAIREYEVEMSEKTLKYLPKFLR